MADAAGATLIEKAALFQTSFILGVAGGYGVAWLCGAIQFADVANTPAFALPMISMPNLSFDARLMLSFALVALVAPVKQTAFVEHAQKVDGMLSSASTVRRGIVADGLGTVASGLLGSLV